MTRKRFFAREAVLRGALLAALCAAAPAFAAPCGDDVDGRDVPCACGDVVVSNVVLGDDPVATTTCSGDGLVIRAPRAAHAMRIDLAGAQLRGGVRGTGLRVQSGGDGGVHIFSSRGTAVVEGFRDGLVSQAARAGVAELIGVRFQRQGRDGVRIFGDGLLVRDIEIVGAQRDGAFVRGDGWVFENVLARQNGRHGLSVMGSGNVLRTPGTGASVRAEANAGDGIRLWGDGNLLFDCIAASNGASGVGLNGVRFDVRRCEAVANGDGGLRGSASQSRFYGNVATDNLDAGIGVHGHEVFDAGANFGDGNTTIAPPGAEAVQCRLGLEECL